MRLLIPNIIVFQRLPIEYIDHTVCHDNNNIPSACCLYLKVTIHYMRGG